MNEQANELMNERAIEQANELRNEMRIEPGSEMLTRPIFQLKDWLRWQKATPLTPVESVAVDVHVTQAHRTAIEILLLVARVERAKGAAQPLGPVTGSRKTPQRLGRAMIHAATVCVSG